MLEGGGAKGAYTLGCLTALREKGIEFDVVAGTSVGSLNGALLSSNRLTEGKELWKNLTFSKVFIASNSLLTWLILPIQMVSLILHNFPTFFAVPFASRQPPKQGLLNIWQEFSYPVGMMWIFGLLIVSWFYDNKLELIVILVGFTIALMLLSALWSIPYIARHFNYSVLKTDPLQTIIKTVLHKANFTIPTYATVCKRQEMFDPDNPGFYHLAGEGTYIRGAMSQEEYVPSYVRIDNILVEQRIKILMASAAIPFGIFPEIEFEGDKYIDGGLADNIPIFPILEFHKCDEIFVIRLRPNKEEEIENNWRQVERRFRVAQLDRAQCYKMYREAMKSKKTSNLVDERIYPPENVPFKEYPFEQHKVIVISPSKSLGSFLSGTMNLRSAYTKKLFGMGYTDALNLMSKNKKS